MGGIYFVIVGDGAGGDSNHTSKRLFLSCITDGKMKNFQFFVP